MENIYIVFGAGSGVGFHFVDILRKQNKTVYAQIRSESHEQKLNDIGVKIVKGDAMNMEDVEKIFLQASQENKKMVVVSTIGGKSPNGGKRSDEVGNINIIKQASFFNVSRFLLITSIGCGNTMLTMSKQAMDAFGDALVSKTKAENFLKESALDYTILRPGGLLSLPATNAGTMTEEENAHGYIHREDVAILMNQTIADPLTIRKTLALVDKSVIPPSRTAR